VKLKAQAVMIAQGDLVTQVETAAEGTAVRGLEPYRDARGRGRLRIVWGSQRLSRSYPATAAPMSL
jgi:hypothetical protein